MEITQAEQAAVSVAVSPAERAALALNSTQTERDLRELATKHAGIQAIKDKAGRDQAHGAAMEVKRARTTIERVGKEARDDATKFSKAVIAEQNRLIDIIITEEQRLLALRDAWDTEQEKIREAAAAAERFRVEQIQGRIEAIKAFEGMARNCRTSAAVQRLVDSLEKVDLTGMDEFEDRAQHVFDEAKKELLLILTLRQIEEKDRARIKAEQEAEAARLAAERAELERLRAEAAARANAEADRLAQERATLEAARIAFEQRQRAHEERERTELAAREAESAAAAKAAADAAASAQRALMTAGQAAKSAQQAAAGEFADHALMVEACDMQPVTASIEPTPEPVDADEMHPPSAYDMVTIIAGRYSVLKETARDWLVERAADIAAIEL